MIPSASPTSRLLTAPRASRPPKYLTSLVSALVAALLMVAGSASAAVADFGIDVSRWQHSTSLDWGKVKGSGVTFAFIKATEGSGYTNPYFAADWAATKQVGIYRGAYHFARPSTGSAATQARYFVARAGTAGGRGDLPPVLDLEATGGLGVTELRAWTATWLQTVEELTGRVPILYTSPYFWETYLGNSTAFTRYPLWIANYGVTSPHVPGGWPTWTFWQTSSTGRVNGISGNVDIDRFNGTAAQLAKLAQSGPTGGGTPPPPANTSPAPTTTTLGASRSAASPGQSVNFSGRVATQAGAPVAGRRVTLLRRPAGSATWATAAVSRTDAAGGFTIVVATSGAASYRAVFRGGPRYAGSRSTTVAVALREQAAARVDLGSPTQNVRRGGSVRLYGHLTTADGSALAGRPVDVYRRSVGGTTWRLVATGTSVSPTGWYQASVTPRTDSVYRAVFHGGSRYAAASSDRLAITVR